MKHLVFYDGECGFCDRSVQLLLKLDQEKLFAFAPLQGTTAKQFLKGDPARLELDTLVLIENYQSSESSTCLYGKAVFRILWLLGGFWVLLGWISFLPGFLYNWCYRLVARNRNWFFGSDVCKLPDTENRDRFLP